VPAYEGGEPLLRRERAVRAHQGADDRAQALRAERGLADRQPAPYHLLGALRRQAPDGEAPDVQRLEVVPGTRDLSGLARLQVEPQRQRGAEQLAAAGALADVLAPALPEPGMAGEPRELDDGEVQMPLPGRLAAHGSGEQAVRVGEGVEHLSQV